MKGKTNWGGKRSAAVVKPLTEGGGDDEMVRMTGGKLFQVGKYVYFWFSPFSFIDSIGKPHASQYGVKSFKLNLK